jgi:hypothetical protein
MRFWRDRNGKFDVLRRLMIGKTYEEGVQSRSEGGFSQRKKTKEKKRRKNRFRSRTKLILALNGDGE